jgi:succinoglycan biosynthesis transport protein ExoP
MMAARSDKGGSRAGQEGELDLPGLTRAIRQRKWWVILPTLAALAGSAYAVQVVKPRYTAETRILIESRDGYYTRPSGSSDRDTLDEQHVQSQVLLVSSRDAARQVVERLKLRGNPEFDPAAAPQTLLTTLVALVTGEPPTSQEAVVDKFLERTTIYAAQRSRVITIEFSSSDPELAARGANALADAYLDAQEGAKQDTARAAGTWLQGTIEPLRAKLAETEAKVEAYRASSGLLLAAGTATLQQQQLADLNAQLTAARTAEADARAKADLLREALRNGRPLEISEVANNELVRRLMT